MGRNSCLQMHGMCLGKAQQFDRNVTTNEYTLSFNRVNRQIAYISFTHISCYTFTRANKQVALGRRVGLYRYCGDIGRGNFSRVKLAVHQLTKGECIRCMEANQSSCTPLFYSHKVFFIRIHFTFNKWPFLLVIPKIQIKLQ